MNTFQELRTTTLARRLVTTAMLTCFALSGWLWTHESSTPTRQAHAAIPQTSGSGLAKASTSAINDESARSSAESEYLTKNIEDIQAGDYVLAREEHGNKIAPRRVVEVYRRTSYHLRHLTFESEDGTTQTLHTTDEHPFWHAGREEWLNAGDFVPGDLVTSPTGGHQTLTATHRTEHPEGVPVFNFQVEGWHTYFVGSTESTSSILVHNADYIPEGSFSIINWTGYPTNVPKPTGPFRILEGAEYQKALEAKSKANKAMHVADESLRGLDLHEIHPVKFGGSPTDVANKLALPRDQHIPVTTWWARLLNNL